jgi:glycine cleavage system H lipoate-binding protein
MGALSSAGEWLAIVLGGLAVRLAIAVGILAALVAVLLPVLYAFEGGRRLLRHLRGIQDVHGFEWRRQPRYAATHLWLGERAGLVRLGLDSLAARLLSRARQVELPPVGRHVEVGAPIATFRTGGAGIAVPAPIEGVVARVNPKVSDYADLATRHSYSRGWLVEIRPATGDFRRLPRAQEARDWFSGEAVKLTLALEHATGRAAADGGVPVVPDHLLVTDDQLGQLAGEFLHASVTRQDG